MKKIVIILILLNPTSYYLIIGQTIPTDSPYKINISENFKNIKAVNLSTIGKDLSYIPLETTPECLIKSIDKILLSESYIFVSEKSRLLQFDKNGKFLKQIGSAGSGPGEYLSVGDFCIDEIRKEIYIIFINAPRLLVFGFDGVFKNSYRLFIKPSQVIIKDQNSLMFHLANMSGPKFANNYSWVITDRQGIAQQTYKNQNIRISQPGIAVPKTPFYKFRNSVHFMEYGIDTLYYFNNAEKKTYAVFTLGKLKMDLDPLITPDMIKNHEKFIDKLWIGHITENDKYMFLKFWHGITDSISCAIFSKKANSLTFLKENTFKNDLNGGLAFWPKQVVNDNILIDYADAFDLMKRPIPSNLKHSLTLTSNPVLIILR